MNNFLKYPLTSKNRIIKFEDIKAIKLGGFTSKKNRAHLYRNIGTKSYTQINGTNFSALKDELVPLIIDFDNDFTNESGPVIRFTVDKNNTPESSDDIYSNYYFDIKDKIVMVVDGACYSPSYKYLAGRLEVIIPESIILRSGEELEFVKYGTFVFYKNDNTEILVCTEFSGDHGNLYLNVTGTSEQENIISISINGYWMRIANNYNEFIISTEEIYNDPSEEGEEEGGEGEGKGG